MRWIVTTKDGNYEDVGAGKVSVVDGALLFTKDDIYEDTFILGYAAGEWRIFVEAGYE
jgi:hypothetical protein